MSALNKSKAARASIVTLKKRREAMERDLRAADQYMSDGGMSDISSIAKELVEAGYVKMPSREALVAALNSEEIYVRYEADWVIDPEMAADAILALLAGATS